LASVGSAVGLGNIWRFPTVVSGSGGGAFVLVYLGAIGLLGLPLLMAELALGRRGRGSVLTCFRTLAPGTAWWGIGLISVTAVTIILSFYAVIAGWVSIYLGAGLAGRFRGLDVATLQALFFDIAGHPWLPLAAQAAFLALTAGIVALGVRAGIERWSRVLMPGIVVILLVLLGRVVLLPGAPAGLGWFLRPRPELITPAVALRAVGQVFFSFSLGMGAMVTYGSYLDARQPITSSAVYIALADLAVALLGGLVVIPALFAFGIEPTMGPGLIFVALPAVLGAMPLGMLWSALFFLMLYAAALTSSVAMLETIVAHAGRRRRWATGLAASGVFLLGIPSALAAGPLSAFRPLGHDFLGLADFIASNVLLPLGGLGTAVFVGWVWGAERARAELERLSPRSRAGGAWALAMRYLVPALLAYVFVTGLTG